MASYDRIVGIDDESIEDFNDLCSALDGREAGERVEVHFVRRGEKRMRRVAWPLHVNQAFTFLDYDTLDHVT